MLKVSLPEEPDMLSPAMQLSVESGESPFGARRGQMQSIGKVKTMPSIHRDVDNNHRRVGENNSCSSGTPRNR
jgi:hypothetical protein